MIQIIAAQLRAIPLTTRLPFRFGMVTVSGIEQCFVRVTAAIDGVVSTGFAADGLAPKWFKKDALQSIDDDVQELKHAITLACECALAVGARVSVFDLWWRMYADMSLLLPDVPSLLRSFALSLVERALIDAYCRVKSVTFARALRDNAFEIQLGKLHPELGGRQPAALLPILPVTSIKLRHTVGLIDPLTRAEAGEVHDGLPVALIDCIHAYGLTHFKIKIGGDVASDLRRLIDVASVIENNCREFAFTLDGNEQFADVGAFRAAWEVLSAEPRLRSFLTHLIFVEQPIKRSAALSAETAAGLRAWTTGPVLIIDESDGDLDSVRIALAQGYAGASHKNCKGVFKGIANACYAAHLAERGATAIISGEDLCTLGPVSLLQDLTVMAVLGVRHVERNGHHYFKGLSGYSRALQSRILDAHGDVYFEHERGFASLRAQSGVIDVTSALGAPFGYALDTKILSDYFGF